VTGRDAYILAPRIEAVTPDQKTMQFGIAAHQFACAASERFHVLTVFQNWKPFAMLVRFHALEAFQHLISFDKEAALVAATVGTQCPQDRMRMEYRPGPGCLDRRYMQQRLR